MPGTPLNPANWAIPYKVTIDNTKVGGASNLTNFPVLIKDANIPSSAYAQMLASGADVRFSSDLAGTTELPFHIVTITPGSELAEIWVKVPSVLYNADTEFYLWVGNSSAVAYDANETYGSQAVWSAYRAVYHGQSLTADSTAGARTLTNNNSVASIAAQIKDGADFGTANTNKSLTRTTNIWSANQLANLTYQTLIKVRTQPGTNVVFNVLDTATNTAQNNSSYMGGTLYYGDFSGVKKVGSRFYRTGGSGADQADGNIDLGTSDFHTFACTINGGVLKVYVDGVEIGSATYTGGSMRSPGDAINHLLSIGKYHANASGQFASVITDETRFIESTLTEGQLLTEKNNQLDTANFLTIAPAIDLPTVVTEDPATEITTNSAEGGGEVTDDGGGTVSERGIAWGTSPNPTIAGDHQASGSGTGAFTDVQMTGLDPDTHYYYRAYATNEAGTAYGSNVEFDTLDAVISGTCTLNGNPVEGAIITLINSDTDAVVATDTTDASGNYAFLNLDVTVTYHVVAEYMDGYDMYNARSLPFMTPEEV